MNISATVNSVDPETALVPVPSPKPSLVPAPVSVREEVARIRLAINAGNGVAAQHDAEQLLRTVESGERAMVLNALAQLHAANGNVLALGRVAADARRDAQNHGDKESEAEAILHSGEALQMIEDHAAAIKYFLEAEQLATEAGSRDIEARVWRRMGVSSSIIGRHPQAVDYLERSVLMFHELSNIPDWFGARSSLLNAYNRKVEAEIPEGPERVAAYRPYLSQWDNLANEAQAAGIRRISAIARGNYAITQRYVEDYEGALATLEEVLKQYQMYKMRANVAITFNELGTVYCRLKRFGDALAAFQNALVYLVDGSKREQCDAYAGISQAHEGLGDLAGALGALKKVRTLETALTDQEARSGAERREIMLTLKRFSDQWEKLAKEDTLTNLPNRRALEQWLLAALSRATTAQPVTLLLIDVDHFKQVNDQYGHAIGDRALHTLADLMRQNCRYADFPARYGGEEFILALPQTDLVSGTEVAKRLNHSVAAYHWAGIQTELAVTVSIGVASTTELDKPYASETLIEMADGRLYAAKNAGRNRVVSA
ncbi:MAG: GGDEF domain-containing protein [Betaproteobacteria bacterium]|nr:GGDEF domain-containing protein [Betaproteobacteria bacterium]